MSGKQGYNAVQLRNAIDHESAGDKVDHQDPAAAPLGADDEAAGHPDSSRQVEAAIRQETRREPTDDRLDERAQDRPGLWWPFVIAL